jgi:exopolyphosphatase / guanosine-5'-triphosphate,3'-diphosphate pyrophosphatase
VIPRWEWRSFGQSFGDADDHFAALGPEKVEESTEVYLLSVTSDASVKIRDSKLDVKLLQHVNGDGLEQWKPVLKAPFSLGPDEIVTVFAALGVESPTAARSQYSLDQFVDELVMPMPGLLAVEVEKRRSHYTVDGCMAEVTEVRTGHSSRRTIAVESEDAAGVIAAVRKLGLGARPNVNMARGLKTLVGLGAKRFAVIDVGTNSVKFHISERHADGGWATIVDRAEVTRLGEGLDDTGTLAEAAVERTVTAIAAMAEEARSNGVEAIAAVGTAGLRIAPDRAVLVDAARERAGVEVEVISGEEEARLAYLGVQSGLVLGSGSLVVFDTGGGSSQFTFGRGEEINERFSLNVGAARFTDRYGLEGAVSDETLSRVLDAVAADLGRLDGHQAPDLLVGMGGAVTNLTAVQHALAEYDPTVVQGAVLDLAEVDRQIELYRTRTADQRREIVGLQPKRAEVILAGACIVRTVMTKLQRESLTVSDRGLRHGLLLERFGTRTGMMEAQ